MYKIIEKYGHINIENSSLEANMLKSLNPNGWWE